MVDVITALGAASAVLDLAKFSWKVAAALAKFYQDTKCVDSTIGALVAEVKSLADECDLIHEELREILGTQRDRKPSAYDSDGRLWISLVAKVKECTRAMEDISSLIKDLTDKASDFLGQANRQIKLNNRQDDLVKAREKVQMQTESLRTMLLVINIKVAHVAPGNANRELSKKLDNLQEMVGKLQRSANNDAIPAPSDADGTLIQCAQEIILQGTTMYEASLAAPSVLGGEGAATCNIRVAQWLTAIDVLRRQELPSEHSDMSSAAPSIFSRDEKSGRSTEVTMPLEDDQEDPPWLGPEDVDSDDEIAVELAKAALDAGNRSFQNDEWIEADQLFQETLRQLSELPKSQRGFCDTFEMQYKLAVCAYHTQEPAAAETALNSLFQCTELSDHQRRYVCEIAHLLSGLYIRMSQLDRAEASCEKAVRARRRIYGKADASTFASTALLAHIYQLRGDETKARLCTEMIPEDCRTVARQSVDDLLRSTNKPFNDDKGAEQLSSWNDSRPQITSSLSLEGSENISSVQAAGTESRVTLARCSSRNLEEGGLLTADDLTEDSRADSLPDPAQTGKRLQDRRPSTVSERSQTPEKPALPPRNYLSEPTVNQVLRKKHSPEGFTRSQILASFHVKPRTALEMAIAYHAPASSIRELVQAHQLRYRSRLRAMLKGQDCSLHIAAILGDVGAARCIIAAGKSFFDARQISRFGSSYFSPLWLAILSWQPDIVNLFLTDEPWTPKSINSFGYLDHLTCRSRIAKLISPGEKADMNLFSERFIRTVSTLLKHGFQINDSISSNGVTLLQFAVALGADYDPELKILGYLCNHGADPTIAAADMPNALICATEFREFAHTQFLATHLKSPEV